MKTWRELVAGGTDGAAYGPNGDIVRGAFDALADTRWLSRLGEPTPEDAAILRVRSWDEALAPFFAPSRLYDVHGHLLTPALRCLAAVGDEPARGRWLKAVEDVSAFAFYANAIPRSLGRMADWVDNYLFKYLTYLLAELVVDDDSVTAYFRDLLPWFHAGHFPCGWEGDWPEGKLRVY